MKVEVGDEFEIVGRRGGCANSKCADCMKGVMIVTIIQGTDISFHMKEERTEKCHCNIADIRLIKPTWKQILEG